MQVRETILANCATMTAREISERFNINRDYVYFILSKHKPKDVNYDKFRVRKAIIQYGETKTCKEIAEILGTDIQNVWNVAKRNNLKVKKTLGQKQEIIKQHAHLPAKEVARKLNCSYDWVNKVLTGRSKKEKVEGEFFEHIYETPFI